jgi:general secretion pathway protein G
MTFPDIELRRTLSVMPSRGMRKLRQALVPEMSQRPAPSVNPTVGRRSRQAGFTLVEILVVLSIIGLIMGLVGPRVLGYLTDSKLKAAKIQVETLSGAVELFFLDNGRYPLESEGLQALVTPPAVLRTWNGPYLRTSTVPLDPWGRPFKYASKDRGRSFSITFAGTEARDGEEVPRRQVSSSGF